MEQHYINNSYQKCHNADNPPYHLIGQKLLPVNIIEGIYHYDTPSAVTDIIRTDKPAYIINILHDVMSIRSYIIKAPFCAYTAFQLFLIGMINNFIFIIDKIAITAFRIPISIYNGINVLSRKLHPKKAHLNVTIVNNIHHTAGRNDTVHSTVIEAYLRIAKENLAYIIPDILKNSFVYCRVLIII